MHSVGRSFFIGSVIAVLGAGLASAQNIDFNLFATENGNTIKIQNDQDIPLVTPVGTQSSVTVTATYTGISQATITQVPQISSGSIQFTVVIPKSESFPLILSTSQSFTFTVTYTAANANGASAVMTIPYTEPGPMGTTVSSSINLSFTGASAAFTLSYALANGNQNLIQSGGTINFKTVQLNLTATATLQIANTGSAPGAIVGITGPPSTSPFQLNQVPLASTTTPFPLPANSFLSLPITYTPTAVENDTAQITITFQNGPTETINLAGSGVTSTFTYSYLPGTGTTSTPVPPNGTITFTPVNVATSGTTPTSSTVIVQVKNTGAATGTINSVNVSPPFQLVNPPVTFPITLATGGVTSFTISYTPTQVGPQTGELVIGSAVFTLSGTGLGPQLTFAYVSGGTTVQVGAGGAVVFPSIAVSQSEQVMFTVTNSGTTAATIALVSASPTPPFSVPTLSPFTLGAGKSNSFPVTFAPVTVGTAAGTLLVNNTSVPLVSAGTAPPALPNYTFSGPSGNVAPASQAGVSLTLDSPYPMDLQGVLTLTTSGTLGTDPNVQFLTGGRTVPFVIPANTTSANFGGQGSQILLQTGTVAETVILTPSFATTGGLPLTPASPPTLQFTVGSLAPFLESIQVTNTASTQTTASFTLVIVGYTTTRSLSSLNVNFTAATGFNVPGSIPAIDLSGAATVWFQSTASQSFGGQFQVAVPFSLTGTAPKGDLLLQAIASVSATIGNSVGTSSSLQETLQ
ncbi:MAG: choice-of-anchor D domain-containing protein [Bryobacteraceae bacterium]